VSRAEVEERLAVSQSERDRAFDALCETAVGIAPVVEVLRPLAKQDFRVYSDVVTA
jgi:hypothetical protein